MADKRQRPAVPVEHTDEKLHRRLIAQRANVGLPLDGTHVMQSPIPLKSYLVVDLPDAAIWEGAVLYVSDETGGAVIAFSDGTNWRRVTDRAIVS